MDRLINQYSNLNPIYHAGAYNIYPIEKHTNGLWYVSANDTTGEYGVVFESTHYHPAEVIMCIHCSSIINCIEYIEQQLKTHSHGDQIDVESSWSFYQRTVDIGEDIKNCAIVLGGSVLSMEFPVIIEFLFK